MGAYTQLHIFREPRLDAEIRPSRTEWSRSGRHWRDIWLLDEGTYWGVLVDISNSGRHYCDVLLIQLHYDDSRGCCIITKCSLRGGTLERGRIPREVWMVAERFCDCFRELRAVGVTACEDPA